MRKPGSGAPRILGSYGGLNAEAFVKRMHAIQKLYRKPIRITEFAVGDWKAKSAAENRYKPDDVLSCMEEVLPQLDKLDFIERYAWFPSKVDSAPLGSSALFDPAGKLNVTATVDRVMVVGVSGPENIGIRSHAACWFMCLACFHQPVATADVRPVF